MRNHRVTAPLVLVRILRRLWDEGHLKDMIFLTEADFPGDGVVHVRGHSDSSGEMEWRTAYWDEEWDVAGR